MPAFVFESPVIAVPIFTLLFELLYKSKTVPPMVVPAVAVTAPVVRLNPPPPFSLSFTVFKRAQSVAETAGMVMPPTVWLLTPEFLPLNSKTPPRRFNAFVPPNTLVFVP